MKGARRPTLVQAANKDHRHLLAQRTPVLDLMNLAAGDDDVADDTVFPALFLSGFPYSGLTLSHNTDKRAFPLSLKVLLVRAV